MSHVLANNDIDFRKCHWSLLIMIKRCLGRRNPRLSFDAAGAERGDAFFAYFALWPLWGAYVENGCQTSPYIELTKVSPSKVYLSFLNL